MRLSKLAKDLDQKAVTVQKYLTDKFGEDIDFGLNAKISEEHIASAVEHFGYPVVEEEFKEEIKEVSLNQETISIEEVTEEVEEKKEIVPERIELPEVKELKKEVVSEEPVRVSNEEHGSFEMKEGEVINALGSKLENGVIRAPKAEKLKGVTVVNKIELPEKKIASKEEEVVEGEGGPEIITNETLERDQRALRKKKREEAKQKAKENKLKREIKSREQKKKREEKALKAEAEKKQARLKEIRTEHYKSKMAEQAALSEKGNKPTKKKTKKSSTNPGRRKKVQKPEPTTLWGKFWRWFNAE